jgi:hypothetical protein
MAVRQLTNADQSRAPRPAHLDVPPLPIDAPDPPLFSSIRSDAPQLSRRRGVLPDES